jgi:hypothetical protein
MGRGKSHVFAESSPVPGAGLDRIDRFAGAGIAIIGAVTGSAREIFPSGIKRAKKTRGGLGGTIAAIREEFIIEKFQRRIENGTVFDHDARS